MFSRRDGDGGGGDAAWDAAASRLYAWDPSACGAHRIGVRTRDPDAENGEVDVTVESAVPSEVRRFSLFLRFAASAVLPCEVQGIAYLRPVFYLIGTYV